MRKIMLFASVFLASLAITACAADPSKGPTYPGIGTVDQKKMEQTADAARLTYFGILNLAAEYASLPRCTAASSSVCSAQNVVNELRKYSAAADTATKTAQDIAHNPTKSSIPAANAIADAQRAIEGFRAITAKVRPAANQVQ